MGSRLLRKQSDELRLIWVEDDALAPHPGEERFVEAEFADIKPGETPTIWTIRGLGNSEMTRINVLVGAGQIRAELAQYLMATSAVVSIQNGDEILTEKSQISQALELEYPAQLRIDLAREVLWIAEGGPPGARRFRGTCDTDAAGTSESANRSELPDVSA